MNLYIWKDAPSVTGRYHEAGGVIAAAPDLSSATDAITSHCVEAANKWEPFAPENLDLGGDPDKVLPLPDDTEPFVMIFPDSGCC